MIFRQLLHFDPVGASYVFGCGGKASAAVVDPQLDIEPYLKASEETGMNIKYVIDTHLHADHLSGGRKLAEETGAKYVLHKNADVKYDFFGVQDGDFLDLGNVKIRVLHTPGHTPEHISLLVTDRTRGEDPWFVLTGHTLMIGDVGRTELASNIEEGARDLYHSVFEKLLGLEDHIEIYPGAFSGSVCGRSLSGKPFSTIGFEKRFNPALQRTNPTEFIQFMLENIPPQPDDFQQIRQSNQGY
ncbi:MBL fold metallo-hydrolase [Melghirimyces algeriensis]|uniref:Glyoxylase, beta-lactamase superfamily II n=1 Tax=Melghirimyces algeriensis TaxID=910412 RepID=A0A521CE39_9BACL|nr:MBL fold metallo-hydrolase [Melghirimyces algeriensis]SMO57696.1 Glyoxylase, beta-lactamase superfamily II [Melghirimyces algeriensis]